MRFRILLTAPLVALAVLASLLLGATPASAQPKRIIVWVDSQLRPTVREVLPARFRDHRIIVRRANMAQIGQLLDQVPADSAPDLILIPNEIVGPLADVTAITPVNIPAAIARTLNRPSLAGFRYGRNYFGVPVLRQNMALVSNVSLVPQAPKTFRRLANRAVNLANSGRATVPFAVAQGPEGNAFTTYPLFSGLGGYVYGANSDGSLKPDDIGLDNSTFRANNRVIDEWNSRGLLRSALTEEEARTAFLGGQSPFWITGPQDIQRLKTGSFRYRITPVPEIVSGQTPAAMVSSWGFAMTSFASDRGITRVTQRFLREVIASANTQAALSEKSPIVALPASTPALAQVKDPVLLAFGAAATNRAVPAPNLPLWPDARGALGGAWRNATSGAEATPARRAFRAAQESLTGATAEE
jgi:arabinogalactan oligomer/maltooligosaccharide transport system substrate-binding protein